MQVILTPNQRMRVTLPASFSVEPSSRAGFCFQIADKPLKSRLIRAGVLVPVAELGDEVSAHLTRRIEAAACAGRFPLLSSSNGAMRVYVIKLIRRVPNLLKNAKKFG
jgi:hypothetical protein